MGYKHYAEPAQEFVYDRSSGQFVPQVSGSSGGVSYIPSSGSELDMAVALMNGGSSGGSSDGSGTTGAQIALDWTKAIGGLALGGLSALTSWKNGVANRKMMAKQMQVAQEQINASQQARKERAAELARLNKVRSNTNKQYNTASQVSRSY